MSPTMPLVAPVATPRQARTGDQPVRWGFLTAARIANKWAADLALTSDAELVAVASRDRAKAEIFADTHRVGAVHDDYRELVERDDLDIIYVASPHHLHREHALLAIEAGTSVLVEKPTTTSAADTLTIFEAAAAHGVFAMEAMWTRCNPLIREAAALLRRGVLGAPVLARADFPVQFIAPDEHRIFNPDLAGGAVLDLGVYPAHVLHCLLGRPSAATATGTTTRTGVDNTSVAQFCWDLDGGRALGTVATTLSGRGRQILEVIGTEATLTIENYVKPTSMTLSPHQGKPQEFVTSLPGLGYTFQAHEVHHCLRTGASQSSLVDWQSSLDVAWMLDAWLDGIGSNAPLAPPSPLPPIRQDTS